MFLKCFRHMFSTEYYTNTARTLGGCLNVSDTGSWLNTTPTRIFAAVNVSTRIYMAADCLISFW